MTKGIELVSDTIKNCVHSSEVCGGVIKIRWGGRGQQGPRLLASEPPTEIGVLGKSSVSEKEVVKRGNVGSTKHLGRNLALK